MRWTFLTICFLQIGQYFHLHGRIVLSKVLILFYSRSDSLLLLVQIIVLLYMFQIPAVKYVFLQTSELNKENTMPLFSFISVVNSADS